jgi:hypothetical protein
MEVKEVKMQGLNKNQFMFKASNSIYVGLMFFSFQRPFVEL